MRWMVLLVAIGASAFPGAARAQAVEVLGGSQRTTLDVMFFRPFLLPAPAAPPGAVSSGAPVRSNVLFFFRARAGVGYHDPDTLPQFGLTSAVSYNLPVLKGFAPVVVGQAFNRGVFPKAGVQFTHVDARLTIFTWLVCETLRNPVVDYFLLARYTHPLSDLLGLFFQAESVSTFPTSATQTFSFFERARLGLEIHRWQIGPGVDVSHIGRDTFAHSYNVGGFARYNF